MWYVKMLAYGRCTVRTVVVADEMDDPSPPDNVTVNVLSDDQVAQIKQIHSSFLSLFSEYTGSTSLIEISINIGTALPFQSVPYRLPVALVQAVKEARY